MHGGFIYSEFATHSCSVQIDGHEGAENAKRDNFLTVEELTAWFKGQGREALPPGVCSFCTCTVALVGMCSMSCCGGFTCVHFSVTGLMDHEDKNEDGKISWEEFSGPKGDAPPHVEL